MKLTVFGPTGGTGIQIVRQALVAGHEVRAVARRPETAARMLGESDRLSLLAGDVLDSTTLTGAVPGADAVVSALGAHPRDSHRVYSAGITAILAVMRAAGVRRFIGITAAPAAPPAEHTWLAHRVVNPLLERLFGVYGDMRQMERLLAASDRDWTIFRPPRLRDRPGTGHYRQAIGRPLSRGWSLPRADLAAAMLAAIEDPALIGQAVNIAT